MSDNNSQDQQFTVVSTSSSRAKQRKERRQQWLGGSRTGALTIGTQASETADNAEEDSEAGAGGDGSDEDAYEASMPGETTTAPKRKTKKYGKVDLETLTSADKYSTVYSNLQVSGDLSNALSRGMEGVTLGGREGAEQSSVANGTTAGKAKTPKVRRPRKKT